MLAAIRATNCRAALLTAGAVLCLQLSTRGERFLELADAKKICFPNANFREETIRLTRDQVTAIQKRSEMKVRKAVVRMFTATEGTNVAGLLFFDQVIGKHELIDYVVAVSPDGAVRQVEILEYREHYGARVRDADWREQFKGKTGRDPIKLNSDIYNITGATLSCRHVTEGIRRVLATFDIVVRPRLSSAGVPNKPAPAR